MVTLWYWRETLYQLTMEQARNIRNTQVMVIWTRKLDLEDIVREARLNAVNAVKVVIICVVC